MWLINENYKKVDDTLSNEHKYFWIYDCEQRDFFLQTSIMWFSLKTDCYILSVGGKEVIVPFNFPIMIGDYDAGLDTIKAEEIVGRPFDVVVLDNTLDHTSLELLPVEVIGYKQSVDFLLPQSKHPFPVLISDSRAILIGQQDYYQKIKNAFVGEIFNDEN